jgi:hypothetical protein
MNGFLTEKCPSHIEFKLVFSITNIYQNTTGAAQVTMNSKESVTLALLK